MNWKWAKFTFIDFSLSRIVKDFLVGSNPGDEREVQDGKDVDFLERPDSRYQRWITKPVNHFGKSWKTWRPLCHTKNQTIR